MASGRERKDDMKNGVLCPCMDMTRHFDVIPDVHVLKLNLDNYAKYGVEIACGTPYMIKHFCSTTFLSNYLAIIKFFGFLSIKNPGFVFDEYPKFYEFLFNCITSNDSSLLPVALDTIGAVGLSNAGLAVLFQRESHRNVVLSIGRCLQTADEQMK